MRDVDEDLLVVALDDPAAADAAVVGAKAANLARAWAAGLPVLPGLVITTAATAGGEVEGAVLDEAWVRWEVLDGSAAVVRSSSTIEDAGSSSMAGQFTSVLDVRERLAFDDAVRRVVASAAAPRSGLAGGPMAVLVQPQLDTACGGVLFGVDPMTGDRRSIAVDAVAGAPEQVVSGRALASHLVLSPRGRLQSWVGPPLDVLDGPRRRALARLARAASSAFGAPQDVEWAFDHQGRLWLLQSRPVTATACTAHGPVYGPAPLAETFPDPLAPLEVELWVDPLREAIEAALAVIGVVPNRRLRRSQVVAVVGGRPAIDLELIGATPRSHHGIRRLGPVRNARRFVAAWRTGRLRAALPLLVADLLDAVDRELLELDDLRSLDAHELLAVLEATRSDLRALHGYEVLCGMLLGSGDGLTAAGLALDAVARSRRAGLADDAAVRAEPVVLALVPPAVGRRGPLPDVAHLADRRRPVADLPPREALRLRVRWAQELGALAATELGRRLVVPAGLAVRDLALADLAALVEGGSLAGERAPFVPGPPLPAMFRLGPRGVSATDAGTAHEGVPASAGRATGPVRHLPSPPAGDGDVLVVDALVPDLAGELEHVAAIVSETGSPLSHLAILARERSVPVAVGVADARRRFPAGTWVVVDGGTGSVTVVEEPGR